MTYKNAKRNFLFFVFVVVAIIYSQRICKPIVDALFRVVCSCSNKDKKDFESTLLQNGKQDRENSSLHGSDFYLCIYFQPGKEC